MAFSVITGNKKPKKIAHIYQSFENCPSTHYTTVDENQAEAKMEILKRMFPKHSWTVKYETI